MIRPEAFVIVPVKAFHGAKRRLAPVLGTVERAALARAMLADVLAAAVGAVGARQVLVVTGDDEVADEARGLGVGVVDDEGAHGTNAAVKIGFAAVARRGGGAVLALPGDVPGVIPGDLAALFAAAQRMQVALAPAPEDGGTNALACDAVGRIAPCFGPDSFARHIAAANAAGIRPAVLLNQRLGLDLDEPHHLQAFLERSTPSRTDGYLRGLELGARNHMSAASAGAAGIGPREGAAAREAHG